MRGRPRSFDRDVALDKAMRLFWERGYEGVSLAELTAAMGINASSLYTAFGGKEELFRAAVERYGATFGRWTMNAMAEQPTARAAIEAMLRDNAAQYTSAGEPNGCMVALAAVNCAPSHEVIKDFLGGQRELVSAAVLTRLRQAVEDGEVAADADLVAIRDFYLAVLNGMSLLARDGATRQRLAAVVDGALGAWPGLAGAAQVRAN